MLTLLCCGWKVETFSFKSVPVSVTMFLHNLVQCANSGEGNGGSVRKHTHRSRIEGIVGYLQLEKQSRQVLSSSTGAHRQALSSLHWIHSLWNTKITFSTTWWIFTEWLFQAVSNLHISTKSPVAGGEAWMPCISSLWVTFWVFAPVMKMCRELQRGDCLMSSLWKGLSFIYRCNVWYCANVLTKTT